MPPAAYLLLGFVSLHFSVPVLNQPVLMQTLCSTISKQIPNLDILVSSVHLLAYLNFVRFLDV